MEESFPVFLKLINGKSFYRISSFEEMTEYQQLGSRWLEHRVFAKILPERLLIMDLLNNETQNVVRVDEEEFRAAVLGDSP